MVKIFTAMAKEAEKAVRGLKDKDLRKEAFSILLLKLLSTGAGVTRPTMAKATKKVAKKKVTGKKAVHRPGRAGGGVVTTALNKLRDGGYFRKQRDAATVFKEMKKRRVDILPSQLRMELLRFARSGKLKRKIKMKGKKVTYLYGIR